MNKREVKNRCYLCGGEIVCINLPKLGFSVTGDNRIIKYNTELFQCLACGHLQKYPRNEVIQMIYSNFTSDVVLPHSEQVKFSGNKVKPRSYFVFENIIEKLKEINNSELNILDIGAGSGDALRSFVDLFPNAKVYAYDINDNNRCQFLDIKNFQKFYTDLQEINEKFDCIVAFHSLINDGNIKDSILSISKLLKTNGIFVIQAPDIAQNIWDAYSYEPCHNFYRDSLGFLLESCGFSVEFPLAQINREITCVGKIADKIKICCKERYISGFYGYPRERVIENIKMLEEISINTKGRIAIFGSSMSATIVSFILKGFGFASERMFFLEDDKRKAGKKHYGIDIILTEIFSKIKSKYDVVLLPFSGEMFQKRMIEIFGNRNIAINVY